MLIFADVRIISFYINLVIGAPSILFVLFFYKAPAHYKVEHIGWKEFIYTLDLPGVAFVLSGLTCFILALEYGGITKPWNSGTVIGLLVTFGVLTVLFIILEYFQGDRALLVGRLMKRRTIAALAIFVSMYVIYPNQHGASGLLSRFSTFC